MIYRSFMNIQSVNANKLIGLQDFLTDAQHIVDQCGNSPLLVLSNNKPAFYVMPTRAWELICTQLAADQHTQGYCQHVAAVEENAESKRQLVPKSDFILGHIPDQRTFDRKNNFVSLAEKLLDLEWERVNRGEFSAASVAIQKNRLDAHVLPFFRYVAPAQTTHIDLDGFVSRLTQHQLSSTTISQYLVLVRKLLKLAVRQGLLKEVPEFPQVRVTTQPRTMLTLAEYWKIARTSLKMARSGVQAPPLKSTDGHRDRFWVAPRNMMLAPDMFWAIRFMVNSFVRPGDLRQLKHKHVTVIRSDTAYLRLNLPETKKHDKPMVTMQSAVGVYESALKHAKSRGFGEPDDYVFLPAEKDRSYALAVLGFWFKWVMREAGVSLTDGFGRPRTLYCLRHTSIMFRLLYGQGIDMLTLARNARTSVQMIERFYASSLDGEMNVAMLQSRRSGKSRKP
jgi:PHD/YefM family antitoxin component YafN of YafNO toxin-antitoxin module